jgi:poly(3-hydroxybutyrate) depolymerase
MLYTFQHGGTLRSFGFLTPPDWFNQVPLPLFVLLHGGRDDGLSDVVEFIGATKVDALFKYSDTTPTLAPSLANLDPGAKPKFVALFPVGLGQDDQLTGGWKCGHMVEEARLFDVDDVSFVLACVDRLQSLLANQYYSILGTWPGPIVDPLRRYAAGFGQGGQLCYKLAGERPGFFKAIAVHSAVPSGWEYRWQNAQGLPAQQLARDTDDSNTSVLHIHGNADDRVHWDGISSLSNVDVQDMVGTTDFDRVDDNLALTSGVGALWATGTDWPAAPTTLGGSMIGAATLTAESVEWVNTTSGAIVRLWIVDALGHQWATDPATFDAIGVMWDFFLGLP